MRYARGLVVGKFSPLHRGHALLIERALAQCDALLLLSYSQPELPGCDAARRQRWLEAAFPAARCLAIDDAWLAQRAPGLRMPDNHASDEAQRAFVARLCGDVLDYCPDAVFTSEAYGDGFAAYLSRALPGQAHVTHVLVDLARGALPISATRIRADVHGQRAWLPPHVYADFVERVAILGGESSGKSTLTVALARALGTACVQEYGRELWEQRGGQLAYADYLQIAREQIAREERAAQTAVRHLICDTTPLTTLFYCRDQYGRAEPQLEALAERSYALQVLCAPDFPFVQDGTRRDAAFRARQHQFYLDWLTRRGLPYVIAAGDLQTRVRVLGARLGS